LLSKGTEVCSWTIFQVPFMGRSTNVAQLCKTSTPDLV
jgi:hypothetical protein